MARFIKKPIEVEAITFNELVKHGRKIYRDQNLKMISKLPWSFHYNGHPITHENDNCYLIVTLEGTMRFNRGDMLITGVDGEIYPCKASIFRKTYKAV